MGRYHLAEEGYLYDTITAPSLASALATARANVDPDSYETRGGTLRVHVTVTAMEPADGEDAGDSATSVVELEPEEPDCAEGEDHDWQTPLSVVGGIASSPGVHGHGGGIVSRSVCARCGAYRVCDSWAQDPSDGTEGHSSTRYEPADERSLEWVASLDAED